MARAHKGAECERGGQAHTTAVNTCCMALARCSLADDGDNISDSMKEDRTHWRGWLRDVQIGKVVLPGVPSVSAGDGNVQRRLTAKPRTGIADYRLGRGWR